MSAASRPRILVVDDEADLRRLLVDYLSPRGLAVCEAADGRAMRAELARTRPRPVDLVILDVGIGPENGFDLLAELRVRGDLVPVLMLTGQDDLEHRVAGLSRGADDYVAKPFEPRELLARIRAVLRRAPPPLTHGHSTPAMAAQPVRLGRCLLDPALGRLTSAVDGSEILLTAMELELLRVMLRHPGLALSRERLGQLAHGALVVGRAVDAQVMRLRRRLEPNPARPQVLRTVRGEGYLLAPGAYAHCEASPAAKANA